MDLLQYAWVAWLVVAVIFFIIEMMTLEFSFLMMGAGALTGMVASLTGLPVWAQILIAVAAAVVLLLLLRPVLRKAIHRGGSTARSNVDALPGLNGEVVVPFERGTGQVLLANGETWTARLSSTTAIRDLDVGERVVVTTIEGATAVVVPAERS